MGKRTIMEESPRYLAVIRYLDEHGARRPPGLRMRQEELAKAVGVPVRTMRTYLKSMETYGVIVVRRTTIDGAFGSARDFNFYSLRVTADRWEHELGPALAATRKEQLRNRQSAVARNVHREKQRTTAGKSRQVAAPRPPAPGAVVLDDEEIAVLSAAYDDLPDEALRGW